MPRVDTYFHLIRLSDSVVGGSSSADEQNGGNSWLRHTAQKIHKISRRRRRSYYFLSPRKDVDLRGTLLEQVVVVVVKITSLLFTLRPSRQQIHKMSYLTYVRTITPARPGKEIHIPLERSRKFLSPIRSNDYCLFRLLPQTIITYLGKPRTFFSRYCRCCSCCPTAKVWQGYGKIQLQNILQQ